MAGTFSRYLKRVPRFSIENVSTNVIHASIGIGAGVIFGGYVGLHTLFINKYRDVFQLYKNGFATKITPEMASKVHEVVTDMKLDKKSQAYLQPFFVSTLDPVHMGSFKMRGGSYVGIPGNFSYKSPGDIERNLITMVRKDVPWNSEAGELFQDSLILSDNAQKFAIARELSHLNTHYVYNFALISCAALYFQYLTTAYLNIKTLGHFKPKSFRYTIYTMVGVFTYGLWSFATDSLTKYYEKTADAEASALGISYARGAVEFYTKVARRNAASREMLGAEGEKLFSKYGNVNNELLRQRHVPVSIRKENAERRVQEMLARETDKA